MSRIARPGTGSRLAALASMLALWLGFCGARAEAVSPAHLPSLQPMPAISPVNEAAPRVRLQLNQRLEYPLDGAPAHLSLGPSLTWTFHAPSAAAHAERQALTDQLAALDRREDLRHDALAGHLSLVRLQHGLWTVGVLDGYIATLLRLRPGWTPDGPVSSASLGAEPGYRSLLQARIDLAAAELNATEQLRSLSLIEPAITTWPEATWRPVLDPFPSDTLELEAACIAGNPGLRRWMLLEAEDAAGMQALRSEAALHGQLTLAASLGVGGGRDPAVSWSASMRFAPANSSAFSFELGLSERAASQSAQFSSEPKRPTLGEPEEAMWQRARQDIRFQLTGLAEAWVLAAETEALYRLLAEAALTRIGSQIRTGPPTMSELEGALHSVRDLLGSAAQRDALTLELAVACGLEVAYEPIDYLDATVLHGLTVP